MKAKDYRKQAWDSMNGNWGTMALITFVHALIVGACGASSYFFFGGVALIIVAGPLTLGLAILAMNLIRRKDIKFETLFDGFRTNFLSSILLEVINSILIALWSLLLIIPGIIKSYSYSMSYYILADNPSMAANDARKLSMKMMHGNKWRLFCLDFSFIGWWLLCGLTFGILSFWITPYQQAARAAFYQSLLPEPVPVEPEQPVVEPVDVFEEFNADGGENA